MKRFLKSTVLAAALTGSVLTGAIGSDDCRDKKVQLSKGQHATFVLNYRNEGTNKVRVQIVDEQGKTVFKKEIRHAEAFQQPFNFEGMDEGKYEFRISDKDGMITETVEHDPAKILPKATIDVLDKERYEISVVGNGFESVYIYVYDSHRKLLLGDMIDRDSSFKKIYNLSEVANNGAVFEVYNRGQRLIAASYK